MMDPNKKYWSDNGVPKSPDKEDNVKKGWKMSPNHVFNAKDLYKGVSDDAMGDHKTGDLKDNTGSSNS